VFDTPRGAQQCTFAFALRDGVTDEHLGTVTPYADTIPVLTHDTTRTIKRTLSMHLSPVDTAAVDPIRDRIVPTMIDCNGTAWPLGRYMFSDFSRSVGFNRGRRASPALLDESFIIDQDSQSAFPPNVNPGTSVSVPFLLGQLMSNFPTIAAFIEPSLYATTNTWAFGTSQFQTVSDLATLGGYFAPWMANDSRLHVIQAFDPMSKIPDVDWDRYPHVVADSIVETDDLLTAPNRFIIVNNNQSTSNANDGPVIGIYDVPVSAPFSIANRGFVIPSVQQLQLVTPSQALAVATTIGITSTVAERVTMTTYPDPRHDSYNVIRWNGFNWLELSWSMNCIVGGAMTHTLRKAYS
jgi:hypothetical protein